MAKIFKTRKLANQYISENYNDSYIFRAAELSDTADWEAVDMPGFSFSGTTPAIEVKDADGNIAEVIGWWEEGDDTYQLAVGGAIVGSFDNAYDARHEARKAIENEAIKDDDDAREVILTCNGEEIGF